MNSFKEIDLLRFPLIVLVVYAHLVSFSVEKIDFSMTYQGVYSVLSEGISTNLGRIPVPCFFLFSGYFFFLKVKEWNFNVYRTKLFDRVWTLLIPFVLWNLLYVLIIIGKNVFFTALLHTDVDELYAYATKGSFTELLWSGPIYFPFWYLRDLICMTLLAPVFYYLFKYLKFYGLLILLIPYLFVIESNISGLSSTAIMYFGLGSFLGIYKYHIIDLVRDKVPIILIFTLAFWVLTLFFNGTSYFEYAIRLFVLIGVAGMLSFAVLLTKGRYISSKLIKLVPTVFFIYAMHQIYILGWIKGFFTKISFTSHGVGSILAYFTMPWICIGICLMLYYLLNKFVPKILAFSLGGRVKK